MAKFYANITLMIDEFVANSGDDAGQIVNDYITKLAYAIDGVAGVDVTWNDCDFVVYEVEED